MQKKLKLPLNAPIIYYQKEWMSLGDYFGYVDGLRGKSQGLLGRIDIIFKSSNLFKNKNGENVERMVICTATRYSDSIWLEDWRLIPYSEKDYQTGGRVLSDDGLQRILRSIVVPLPTLAYYVGDIDDYKKLTYRIVRVVYSHNHNFRNLTYYRG